MVAITAMGTGDASGMMVHPTHGHWHGTHPRSLEGKLSLFLFNTEIKLKIMYLTMLIDDQNL